MVHVLKILEQYADAIVDGKKNFEVRINDRGFNAGDEVSFLVIDNYGIECLYHPLDKKKYKITYVHSGLGMESGYVVFGIKEIVNKADADELKNVREVIDRYCTKYCSLAKYYFGRFKDVDEAMEHLERKCENCPLKEI